MSIRAAVYEKNQIALEVTAGTPVSATKRLLATSFSPGPNIPVTPFRPKGSKYNSLVTVGKEWSVFDIEGVMSYTDLSYLCIAMMKSAGVASPFTFDSNMSDPDTIKTLSMEFGSSLRAEKFNYGIIDGLTLTFEQGGCSISGSGYGRKWSEGATLSGGVTEISPIPVQAKHVDVYVADTVAGLGAGKLTKCLRAEVAIGGKSRPATFFDSTQDSFTGPVELAPDFTAQIVVEHDSVAAGFLDDLRAADTKFLRIAATSNLEFTVGNPYTLQWTCPFSFAENPDMGEQEDIEGVVFNLVPKYDATYAKPFELTIANGLTL